MFDSFMPDAFPVAGVGKSDKMTDSMPAIPADATVAMAYVPYQKFHNAYDDEMGLQKGTLFPDLDKPFLADRGSMLR